MEVDWRDLQITFGDVEPFFKAVLGPVELEYLLMRQRPIVGDQ
jgi:hypothetical protein